jgi:hypothetical protein
MLSILTVKTGSLYCACSPELDIVSYGACRDEALNNLQDEIRLIQPVAPPEAEDAGAEPLPMLRDDDESRPEYDCPACGRSFSSFTRLDEHLAEHEGPKKCRQCGETIHGAYHKCR